MEIIFICAAVAVGIWLAFKAYGRFGKGAALKRWGPYGIPTESQSLKSRIARLVFNSWPCFWGSGGQVDFISHDIREVRLSIPLTWRTRNYVGTIFGGSMFAACDPPLMLMIIHNLGKDYVVWDKGGGARFRKPGRATLYARFIITEADLTEIRTALTDASPKLDKVFHVDLVDAAGVVHAQIERIVNVRLKSSLKK